jgi:hypothetical protein
MRQHRRPKSLKPERQPEEARPYDFSWLKHAPRGPAPELASRAGALGPAPGAPVQEKTYESFPAGRTFLESFTETPGFVCP